MAKEALNYLIPQEKSKLITMGSEEQIKKIMVEMKRMGRKACEIALDFAMNEEYEHEVIREAINYFMRELWGNFLHPALLAISCEAVGGNSERTTLVGASLVLLTGAADVHDDIIDKSETKGSKMTIFGKFGGDIALLVGDALLFKGLMLLNAACENFPKKKGETVKELIKRGFFKLGAAETLESTFKGNWNISPEEFLEVIKKKAAVAEAAARAGAVIGDATPEEVKDWGRIGQILSMLSNIRDEFVDMFEAEELRNRRDNECLPLPILYAMCNHEVRKEIIYILKKRELTNNDVIKVADIVLETKEVQGLKAKIHNLIKEGKRILCRYRGRPGIELLNNLLDLSREGL